MNRSEKAAKIGAAALVCAAWTAGCASTANVRGPRSAAELRGIAANAPANEPDPMEVGGARDGSLQAYVEQALSSSSAIEAARRRYEGALAQSRASGRLPSPELIVAFYALPVQTRVGAQRVRVGARQRLPWPGTLSTQVDGELAQAEIAARTLEKVTLDVVAEVSHRWWNVWRSRALQSIHREHQTLVLTLSETVRTRISVGQAHVGEAALIDARRARLEDVQQRLVSEERIHRAALDATLAHLNPEDAPTNAFRDEELALATPDETLDELIAHSHSRPSLEAFVAAGRLAHAEAEHAIVMGRPSFLVGVDWIATTARDEDVPQNGQDALIVTAGVTLPIWQRPGDAAQAASLREDAAELERDALSREIEAAVAQAYHQVMDSARRADLLATTLLPQALTAYESSLSQYVVGDAPLANLVLALEAILEIRLDQRREEALHGMAWVALERAVGRRVARRFIERESPRGARAPSAATPAAVSTSERDESEDTQSAPGDTP